MRAAGTAVIMIVGSLPHVKPSGGHHLIMLNSPSKGQISSKIDLVESLPHQASKASPMGLSTPTTPRWPIHLKKLSQRFSLMGSKQVAIGLGDQEPFAKLSKVDYSWQPAWVHREAMASHV